MPVASQVGACRRRALLSAPSGGRAVVVNPTTKAWATGLSCRCGERASHRRGLDLGMTENQQTVERYLDGFRSSDREQVLSCLTEDVEWEIPGAFHVRGKQAFAEHIVDPGFVAGPSIVVARVTEENDVVVTEG